PLSFLNHLLIVVPSEPVGGLRAALFGTSADEMTSFLEALAYLANPSSDLGPRRPPWESESRAGREEHVHPQQRLRNQVDVPWGSLTSQLVLREPKKTYDEPTQRPGWQTDELLHLNATGPVVLFGQFGATYDPFAVQEFKLASCTGFGCPFPAWPGGR